MKEMTMYEIRAELGHLKFQLRRKAAYHADERTREDCGAAADGIQKALEGMEKVPGCH